MGFIDEDDLKEILEKHYRFALNTAEIGGTALVVGYTQAQGNKNLPADAIAAGLLLGVGLLFGKAPPFLPFRHDLTMAGAGALASFAERMGRQFGAK